jgi:non-heme chloroperoxidase
MQRRNFLHTSATVGVSLLTSPYLDSAAASSKRRAESSMSESQDPNRIKARDGTTLYYRASGSGRAVVFVHGWAVNGDIWQYQMTSLSEHARCYAYDKRGHGRSGDPGGGYDYDTLADDLHGFLDSFDLKDVVLVGHSMGPAEIVRYISRHGTSRLSRLVLVSSALPFILKTPDNADGIEASVFEQRRQQWLQDMPKFLAANARSFVLPETSAETVSWVAAMGSQASLKALVDINHAITETDLRADVARVKLPTLVIHGTEDKSAPIELTGKKTAALIPGSQLKIYDGAPHGLLLTHQERLNSDLIQWINS